MINLQEFKSMLKSPPQNGSEMIDRAWELAVTAYNEKEYGHGTGVPYKYHLAEVALKLLKNGYDAHVVTAGILHDILEDRKDTGVTIEDLEEMGFSEEAINGVRYATYDLDMDTEEAKDAGDWPTYVVMRASKKIRKIFKKDIDPETKRRHKVNRAKSTPISWIVKYYDSLCNFESVDKVPDRRSGRPEHNRKKYLRSLLELAQGVLESDDIPSQKTIDEYYKKLHKDDKKKCIGAFALGKLGLDQRNELILRFTEESNSALAQQNPLPDFAPEPHNGIMAGL